MPKVAILVDSIASLPSEIIKQEGIGILPINIAYKGRIYRVGIDLSIHEAYRMLDESPDNFYSSPASIGEYLEMFRETSRRTDQILCITLSSKLSGMYNVASLAAKRAREEFPGVTIHVLDSQNAAVSEGLIVSAAIRVVADGKNLEEVVREAEKVISRVKLIGVLETVRHVYRTGRVPKIAARFGSMLRIRPVITFSDGLIQISGVTKNQESGINRILRQIKEKAGDKPVHVAIAHAEALEAGNWLQERVRSNFNCVELWMTDFSPVMAYATGKGVLIAAYYVGE